MHPCTICTHALLPPFPPCTGLIPVSANANEGKSMQWTKLMNLLMQLRKVGGDRAGAAFVWAKGREATVFLALF